LKLYALFPLGSHAFIDEIEISLNECKEPEEQELKARVRAKQQVRGRERENGERERGKENGERERERERVENPAIIELRHTCFVATAKTAEGGLTGGAHAKNRERERERSRRGALN